MDWQTNPRIYSDALSNKNTLKIIMYRRLISNTVHLYKVGREELPIFQASLIFMFEIHIYYASNSENFMAEVSFEMANEMVSTFF